MQIRLDLREADMTIDELKERKKSSGFTNQDIARITGIPFGTVQKIFSGSTRSPRRTTLVKLEQFFDGLDACSHKHEENTYYKVSDVELAYAANCNREDDYPDQGSYTVEDYYAIIEDKRIELIDGVIYDMATPTLPHQDVAFQVGFQMEQCSREHHICKVYISPVSVQLDKDNRTMVEPDLIVLCDKSLITRKCIYGAPDFVLEVLSPSSKTKDMLIKLNKYWHAGCKEYWIIDPDKLAITVYDFSNGVDAQNYTFDDIVPVKISNGKCSIDFPYIKDRIEAGF